MQEKSISGRKIVILGTGGTIAGTAARKGDNIGYTAAQVGVGQLADAIPGLGDSGPLLMEQVAQLDSKDMSFEAWARLAARVSHHLAQDDVEGVVITHGTDTLEETAFFLHALLSPAKPVVLTCAMRPASALAPDGPQNMLDSAAVARTKGAAGVLVVCAGTIHLATDVQKTHTYALDAFSSRDAGPLGYVEEGEVRLLRAWPSGSAQDTRGAPGRLLALEAAAAWPHVEIVTSHAGANGAIVGLLQAAGVQGIVVAATGNGTVHHSLESALLQAQKEGVAVLRATRCANGRILAKTGDLVEDAGGLTPVKARVLLLLRLMGCAE
ncbi:MAG: asparaginase [Comamonadaceae bacterium]|nr:MAG: asparaginase [Comamonadaceae bacterium]